MFIVIIVTIKHCSCVDFKFINFKLCIIVHKYELFALSTTNSER
jgi:hypothetical protein